MPGSARKIIDPEQFPDQEKRLKRPHSLLAVTRIQANFPATHPLNSLKINPNNIDYHLLTTMFVTFPTKHN
ncbi:hypothetical protein [Pseudomonas baetica]|uniref:hypothetical protein n=1 Tax=Pseudomonas baetica TaxID=674054 RepID=UPI00240603DA|nr:hypothetical protein [Pseudomonas baetica]MDF9774062.1 hypothetical protein [Pseudomonas baetica]